MKPCGMRVAGRRELHPHVWGTKVLYIDCLLGSNPMLGELMYCRYLLGSNPTFGGQSITQYSYIIRCLLGSYIVKPCGMLGAGRGGEGAGVVNVYMLCSRVA